MYKSHSYLKILKGSNWFNNNVNAVSLARTHWPMRSLALEMGAILGARLTAFYQFLSVIPGRLPSYDMIWGYFELA